MVAITVALAAVVATFVYGYGVTPKKKHMPAFSVSRENYSTVSVVLHDKDGAAYIKSLLVQSPDVNDTCELNDTTPTGLIKVGKTLRSVGVNPGEHYVVKATVEGTNRVVIDQWM